MSDAMSDSCYCSDGRDPECPRHGADAQARRAKRAAAPYGLHTHRFRDNPEEQRFAEAWGKLGRRHLEEVLNEGGQAFVPAIPSRDRVVAATVIQWLGSPVGQGFLRELGYERKAGK